MAPHLPLSLAALAFICLAKQDGGFAAAVLEEMSARPLSAAQDIYKLAHQSVFGPGHIISSAESVRGYLEKEMASLGPALPHEKEIEKLGGGMARVNLRPFRDSGGSVERLLDAMLATAAEAADPKKACRALAERIETARAALAGAGKKDIAEGLSRLAAEQAKKGHPPLRHSEAYGKAYLPAYRVVALRPQGALWPAMPLRPPAAPPPAPPSARP